MTAIAMVIVGLIAALHFYIAWFEMFAWERRGPEIFRQFPEALFAPTKRLAANQGLYNGFLAAGLVWSLLIRDPEWQAKVASCFLLFILVAGGYRGSHRDAAALVCSGRARRARSGGGLVDRRLVGAFIFDVQGGAAGFAMHGVKIVPGETAGRAFEMCLGRAQRHLHQP